MLVAVPCQLVQCWVTETRPGGGWHLWRFASLIPSGWRLPPIHKVMGDHASRAATPAGASLPLGLSMMYIPAARTSRKVSRDAATGEFVTYW